MIELARGNLLEADAEALVNTVNCIGYMGKGIALQFKQAFPANFDDYHKACKADQVKPGRMFIHQTGKMFHPKYIINFPTKRHWRGKSRLEDIRSGLIALVEDIKHLGIRSIAVPPLGCGLGGLDWMTVRTMIEDAFRKVPEVSVLLYEPVGTPKAKKNAHRDIPPKDDDCTGLVHQINAAVFDHGLSTDAPGNPETRLFPTGGRRTVETQI